MKNGADSESGKGEKHTPSSGKMKRTGEQAARWDSALVNSIQLIPQLQLPTIRTTLQRYRFLRTENPIARLTKSQPK